MPVVDPPYKREPAPSGYTFTYTQPVRPPQPRATYTLLGIMAGVFILELIVLQFLGEDLFVYLFTIYDGWWWRPWQLLTSTISHWNLQHIFLNGLFFYFFGPSIEGILGRRRFVGLFFLTGAVSGVVQVHLPVLLTRATGYDFGVSGFALGASGALMGIFGLSLILMPKSKMIIFPIFVPIPIWVAGIFYVALDVLGAFNPNDSVGNFAHLSGLGIGLLYGLRVKQDLRRRGLRIVHA
jgi:rhomboid family protein